MDKPATVTQRKRIGDMLVEAGLISCQQLDAALEKSRKQRCKVGEVLVDQKLVTPSALLNVLSHQLNTPIVDLQRVQIRPEALRMVPEDLARRFNVLPLELSDAMLTVAMEDPQNLDTLESLRALTRKRIKPVLALSSDILGAINLHYRDMGEIVQQVRQFADGGAELADTAVTAEVVAQTPIARTVELIVAQAVRDRASDVHIEPQREHLAVRFRIDGILHDTLRLPLSVHGPLTTRIKVLANMNIAERRRPQDGQLSTRVGGNEVDVRVASMETSNGEMMVLRILDRSFSFIQLPELGLRSEVLASYGRLLKAPFGMILVSGPTGSGKTTTLYASLNQLDHKENNVMTIEDPVEYRFDGINQIQINPQADITFARGLRSMMRLDPDVILVGEIRDHETAQIAVQSALTGHLVLSSVHANDAAGSLLRLLDLGVDSFLLTSAVIGILAQRLVRRVCPHCRVLREGPVEEQLAYEHEIGEPRREFYYGAGCNFCAGTGYLGRTGVHELLVANEAIRALLLRRASHGELRAQAVAGGLVPMRRDGMLKAAEGITTPHEIIRNVYSIGLDDA